MKHIITEYFSQMFQSNNVGVFDKALTRLDCRVTDDMNVWLDSEPTCEEIKNALFQMHPKKAPSPDGFHALFFQNFSEVVSLDIVALVKNWWRGTIFLDVINKTCISLIPKCKDPMLIFLISVQSTVVMWYTRSFLR